jgi:transmembrane sensor
MSVERRAFSSIEEQASEWLVLLSERTVSLDARARFQDWLRADPEHARVYEAQKAAFHVASGMGHLLEETQAEIASHSRNYRLAAIAAGVVVALLLGAFSAHRLGWLGGVRPFETRVAQVKDIELADGTRVTLGARSHLDVQFRSDERWVRLTSGEAFFEVARDSRRPFYVAAGSTVIRVLGTKFDVHVGEKAVRVAVLEGRVAVASSAQSLAEPAQAREAETLGAGEIAVAARNGDIATDRTLDREDLGAWRQGRLVYVDARLRDVVADISRYYDGRIELADDAVGDMQLTVAFRADQIDRMLEVLESALPVQADHIGTDRIVLRSR